MKRRELLKSLIPTVAALAVPATVTAESRMPKEMPQIGGASGKWYGGMYREFIITWSGWMGSSNQDFLVGRWVAYNKNRSGWHVYSNYPGATEKFYGDQMLDTGVRTNQIPPSKQSTPSELESYQEDAYARLLKYIDEHLEELTK
jgi:hypothetical protein